MIEYMLVPFTFGESERDLRSSGNHPSQNEVGEGQGVQGHVTRGPLRKMGVKIAETAKEAFMIFFKCLLQVRQRYDQNKW